MGALSPNCCASRGGGKTHGEFGQERCARVALHKIVAFVLRLGEQQGEFGDLFGLRPGRHNPLCRHKQHNKAQQQSEISSLHTNLWHLHLRSYPLLSELVTTTTLFVWSHEQSTKVIILVGIPTLLPHLFLSQYTFMISFWVPKVEYWGAIFRLFGKKCYLCGEASRKREWLRLRGNVIINSKKEHL